MLRAVVAVVAVLVVAMEVVMVVVVVTAVLVALVQTLTMVVVVAAVAVALWWLGEVMQGGGGEDLSGDGGDGHTPGRQVVVVVVKGLPRGSEGGARGEGPGPGSGR